MKNISSLGISVPDHIQKTLQISVAPDKSLTHRAIILGGLAQGRSFIKNALAAGDAQSTIDVFRKLGVKISVQKNHTAFGAKDLVIDSPGVQNFNNGPRRFNFNNSGTTARIVQPILAAIPGLIASCRGDQSLSARSMAGVTEVINAFGGNVKYVAENNRLPAIIYGEILTLPKGVFDLKSPSAQVKSSALLLALTLIAKENASQKKEFVISVPQVNRDHTENLLRLTGQSISTQFLPNDGEVISLHSSGAIKPIHVKIPRDPSSAAFFTLIPVFKPETAVYFPQVLLNPRRWGYFAKLREYGLEVEVIKESGKDVYCEVQGGVLVYAPSLDCSYRGIKVTSPELPSLIDEIPLLVLLSALADSESHFSNLGSLRGKESDRLALSAKLAELFGSRVSISENDDLSVVPKNGSGLDVSLLSLHNFNTEGDHRLEMIIATIKLCLFNECSPSGSMAKVSFPNFYLLLKKIQKIILEASL